MMSLNQRNIEHWQEYKLVNEMLTGRNKDLPKILIDAFECKELKSSLELTPMDKSKGKIVKVKKSEKLPLKRLPFESIGTIASKLHHHPQRIPPRATPSYILFGSRCDTTTPTLILTAFYPRKINCPHTNI